MKVGITEVLRRSSQGIIRPFICRGEDGDLYYVKGNNAGRKALCSEWIAARIADALGLPIPVYKQVEVPRDLVRDSAQNDISDLGHGTCFGSKSVEHSDEFRLSSLDSVDKKLRAKILLFDWWIKNGDRTLGPESGNPNLLWLSSEKHLIIIDHNLAFEDETLEEMLETHVFKADFVEWNSAFQQEMVVLLKSVVTKLDQFWSELPASWTNDAMGISLEEVRGTLSRFEVSPSTFWNKK